MNMEVKTRNLYRSCSESLLETAKSLCSAAKIVIGAEGELRSDTLFLPFLRGVFDFLGKTAIFVFRTVRTFGTVRTQLYLSCS